MKTKNLLHTLIMLICVFTASAQQGINYKAIINDANGDPLVETAVTVQFTILENGTESVYIESHSTTTDVNGIIIVNIGEGAPTPESVDFNSIDWGSNPHFLKTEIDSGDGLMDMGTTEFKAVPYALYAKDGPGATELSDLSDAKSVNGSVYLGPLTGLLDDGSTPGNTSNVAVGAAAGLKNRGKGNIFLGYMAGKNYEGDNKLYINNSSGKPLIHGDFATDVVTINGELRGEDSGDADMKAYIYGSINSDGTINTASSTDGFTTEEIDGNRFIRFTGANQPNGTQYVVLVTPESNSLDPGIFNIVHAGRINVVKRSNGFYVQCYTTDVDNDGGDWDFSVSNHFSFVVYKL